MKVTAKIVADFSDKGRLRAIATVCLGASFLVTGVRIVDCENKGLCVFMPSRRTADNEYKDICFPITPTLYKQIKDAVLAAYENRPEPEQENNVAQDSE